MPLSILATWFYNRSKGSILSPALFHASFNCFPLFLPTVSRTDWLLWVWAAAVIVLDRMWRRDERSTPFASSKELPQFSNLAG